MLEVRKLTKKFNSNLAVDDLSFSVRPGKIFSLIGPNGSGKTTIIKLIVGLLRPTSGQVLVRDADVVANPIQTKALIGYIPDEPRVWPALTGAEFLKFSGALYNLKPVEISERAANLLSIFSLTEIQQEYFENYSRGNKQKFTILAALLHRPKLLLVDEPIVGLDPKSAQIAKELFMKFASEGGAVLLATHTLSVAQEISHTIGILKTGKLVATGNLDELRKQAKLSARANLDEVYSALT